MPADLKPKYRTVPRAVLAIENRIASTADNTKFRVILAAIYFVVATVIAVPIIFGPGAAMSRIDEPTHADYAYAVSHFKIPAKGNKIQAPIREIWSCMGQERYELPPCGVKTGAWSYPWDGDQYNFGHPPVFYAISGFPARLISAHTDLNFVQAARLMSIPWVVSGMIMLYVALRRWKADPALAICAPLLMIAFPRVLHAMTTVNPDAASPLIGALALWLAARVILEQYDNWRLPTLLAAFASFTKVINVIPFLALALLIFARAVRDHRWSAFKWPQLRLPVAIGAGVFLPYALWQVYQSQRGTRFWTNPLIGANTRDVTGFPASEWIETVFLGFNLASDYYLQPPLSIALMVAWTRLLNVLIIGAMFAVIVAFAKEPTKRSLGWMMVAGAVLYPLAVQVQAYLNSDVPQYFPNPTGRYGMALIPGMIACMVFALMQAEYRRTLYLLTLVGLVVVATAVISGAQVG